MRRLKFALAPLILLALGMRVLAAEGDAPRPVRARPPVFPKNVTDLFAGSPPTTMTGARGSDNPLDQPADGSPSNLTWSKLIATDVLEDEIKSYKPLLAVDLRAPGAFKGGGYKKCRRELSLLAVCFAIGTEYDGPFRWKDQASTARDLFAASGFRCTQPTDAALEESKLRAQDLDALLRGDIVSSKDATEGTNDWSKIAERPSIMSRMEQAHQRGLTPWTATQATFTKNTTQIRHEAMILAALAEVIAQPGFELSDDKVFVAFAQALKKNSLEVLDGVKANNFDQTRKAVGNITKTCTACHGAYR